ncbi:LRR receptor-like serine/threonine-protein kinase fls2 [Datura stramonium]|uniref:LRR receptor-like serine/threonine-protein kinase fls2 n=1 Tax=Datura stramonium TaxID=4076 RepID=A0ABS8S8K3_DATST|nr:LRR receptor-like serine/threonine-protein kinase fls2 [Datura stramonium]
MIRWTPYNPIRTTMDTIKLHFGSSVIWANPTLEVEVAALKAFKNSVSDDPSGALVDWTDANHHCNWSGIICDPSSNLSHQHFTYWDAAQGNLSGPIPPEIGNGQFRNSSVTSTFFLENPPELGLCINLVTLNMIKQNDGGDSDDLFNCSSEVSRSGVVPPEISSNFKSPGPCAVGNKLEGELPVQHELKQLNELRLAGQ